MFASNVYNLRVEPDTRNDRGFFVEDTVYQLIGVEPTGWALICRDQATCYYVDPDSLQEVSEGDDSLVEQDA